MVSSYSVTCTNGTYCPVLVMRIMRAFQRITMNVRNNGVCVYNIIPDMGNDGVGVQDVVMNGRSGCICVRCRFLVDAENQQRSSLNDKTHVKGLKDLVA